MSATPRRTLSTIVHEETGASSARVLRILVVEDHDDTAHLMRQLLSRAGYEVHTAGSVAEALAQVRNTAFDLVISDVGLPDGTGFELMRALRAHGSVHGIAVSGRATEEDVDASRAAGFDQHLRKPVDFDLLLSSIALVAARGPRAKSANA